MLFLQLHAAALCCVLISKDSGGEWARHKRGQCRRDENIRRTFFSKSRTLSLLAMSKTMASFSLLTFCSVHKGWVTSILCMSANKSTFAYSLNFLHSVHNTSLEAGNQWKMGFYCPT